VVELSEDASTWVVTPSNVESFSISPVPALVGDVKVLVAGGAPLELARGSSPTYFVREEGRWQVSDSLAAIHRSLTTCSTVFQPPETNSSDKTADNTHIAGASDICPRGR
jgi:hypothetical protein